MNRMRSRSMARRSAPSSAVLEKSVSRLRSRSAHREPDHHSRVSLSSAAAKHCFCAFFFQEMHNANILYIITWRKKVFRLSVKTVKTIFRFILWSCAIKTDIWGEMHCHIGSWMPGMSHDYWMDGCLSHGIKGSPLRILPHVVCQTVPNAFSCLQFKIGLSKLFACRQKPVSTAQGKLWHEMDCSATVPCRHVFLKCSKVSVYQTNCSDITVFRFRICIFSWHLLTQF